MSKPESVKVEPWADFPKQSYSLFTDDFVHEKITFKLNAKGPKSSGSLKVTANKQDGLYNLQEEARLWWGLAGDRAIFTKIKHDYLKLHLDNGITERWGAKWNLYGSVNTNKSLGNLSVRLGAHALTEKVNSDNRLKIAFTSTTPGLTWYNRTVFTEGKLSLGSLTAVGLSSKVLAKNNLFLGFKVNDRSHFFLRAENEGYRKDSFPWNSFIIKPHHIFDTLKLDFVSAYKESGRYGIEAVVGVKERLYHEVLFVYEHEDKANKVTGKVKLSTNFDATLAVKFPSLLFKDIATTSIGLQGVDLLGKRNFKYGMQVEFNV